MPSNKNQHFVPRCHLRPFSLDGAGNAINLFNIKSGRFIANAPLKNQCSRDYFYGEDDRLEKALQYYEGNYASIVNKMIENDGSLSSDDRKFILDFLYLQMRRTETAISQINAFALEMERAAYEGRPVEPGPEFRMSHKQLIALSLQSFVESRHIIFDLDTVILKSPQGTDFVTSDDPAVMTNKFSVQKLRERSFGMLSAGIILAMPLSPRYSLLAYDAQVYRFDDHHNVVRIKKADVAILNELQYIKTSSNIYFSDWSCRASISEACKLARVSRPPSWVNVKVYVQDDQGDFAHREQSGKVTRWREAVGEERYTARQTIQGGSISHPIPSRWLSGLEYKLRPKMYSNGSAAGYVRKAEWLTEDGRKRPRSRTRSASK